jgi:hypothetical protein
MSTGHTRTKLPTNKSRNGMYATMLKEGHMLLRPQYGKMTRSSRSTSTTIGMDASS